MALTSTEEALVRQLLDQQAAILSLAGNEATITSKLGATKVTMADLAMASSVGDSDLFLVRQGTNDKSVTGTVLRNKLNSFLQDGVGAVERTIQSKLSEYVSVKDFGAVGDGTANDTTAIQAAITAVGLAGGGAVWFPAGTYKISSQLSCIHPNVVLIGESRFASYIIQNTLTSKVISVTNNFCGVKSLSLGYSGTPLSGATALYCFGSYCSFDDFVIRSSFIAIEYDQGVAGKITNFELLDYESSGLYAHDLNDLFVSRFIMNAGNTARGVLGGIRLVNKVEAFICCDGDILLGRYSMTMEAVSYTVGNRPAYNNFTNVFFDSAELETQILKCVETEFVGCWFSGGRSGVGFSGAIIDNCQSIRLTNCRFFNCGSSGCVVNSPSATDITFTACKAESNSVTKGVGIAHGFEFGNGCTQFQLIGCTASNGLYSGTQGYGIFIGTGCDQFVVRDCNLVGNVTGALLDGTSDITTDKTIHGNIGYRTSASGATTIASGATTVVVNHGLPFTPKHSDILLTRGTTNASSVDLYVDETTITSTQFTIRTTPAPSVNITIIWQIRGKGA